MGWEMVGTTLAINSAKQFHEFAKQYQQLADITRLNHVIILAGCAQTAAVLDDSMLGGMGDR